MSSWIHIHSSLLLDRHWSDSWVAQWSVWQRPKPQKHVWCSKQVSPEETADVFKDVWWSWCVHWCLQDRCRSSLEVQRRSSLQVGGIFSLFSTNTWVIIARMQYRYMCTSRPASRFFLYQPATCFFPRIFGADKKLAWFSAKAFNYRPVEAASPTVAGSLSHVGILSCDQCSK